MNQVIMPMFIGGATGLLTYAWAVVIEDFNRDHPGVIRRILWGVQKK